MSEYSFKSENPPDPDTEIWIAENLCYRCIGKYTWWNKLFAKLLLGWKIKKI